VPVCWEHNEACWQRNRRDRFVALAAKPSRLLPWKEILASAISQLAMASARRVLCGTSKKVLLKEVW
jgi:hypothetical protein